MAHPRTASLDGDSKSLAHSINAAISSSHTKINRLILERMPRAVPPLADNPSNYITGLLHFGAVYIAFESLWQNILGIHTEIAPIPYTYPFGRDPDSRDETPRITERTRHILETMYWPNMLRFARIKADIRTMTGWPQHVVDEQIRSVGTTGRLAKFLAHVQKSVNSKPHLLLAYAYALYLALLSGGSYIRTELMYLKADFWQAPPTPIKPNMIPCNKGPAPTPDLKRHETVDDDSSDGLAGNDPSFKMPLEFLDFDPPFGENPRQQAKDLKAEFKKRFTDAEQALTQPEREDIIEETLSIFRHLEEVVGQLDNTCDTAQVKGHVARVRIAAPESHPRSSNLGSRLRDSIAIAKGRLLRTRRRSSGASSVTAMAPTLPTEATTPSSHSISSKTSSESSSFLSRDFKGAQSKQRSSAGSDLAHDAVLPGQGFRAINYDGNVPAPNKLPFGSGDLEKLHAGLDGTDDDLRRYYACCPFARIPGAQMPTARAGPEAPNYALYAMLSNFVVLLWIAMLFTAYLYVRHGDSKASPLDLRMTKDW